jgi:hypothetical protein
MPFSTPRQLPMGVPLNPIGSTVTETVEQLSQHYLDLQTQIQEAKAAGNVKKYLRLNAEWNRAEGALQALHWVRGSNGAFQI